MRLLRQLRTTLKVHRRTYLWHNITIYGALAASLGVGAFVPGLRDQWVAGATSVVSLPGLSAVTGAYASGDVVLAAALTFVANLLLAALLTTTVPSLAIPFIGVVATVGRAALIGVLLAPTSPGDLLAYLPHALVLVVEFQAYVLAAFGSTVLWQKTLAPDRYGLRSARAGYRSGLRDNARLYVVIGAILFLAAGYEAVEVIYLLPKTP